MQYELSERRQVQRRTKRALAALREAEPGAEALSLRRDVLPKLEVGRQGAAQPSCAAVGPSAHCRFQRCCLERCLRGVPCGTLAGRLAGLGSSWLALCPPATSGRTHSHLTGPCSQLLEAVSPGLGWRVFSRFPEEFASPEAVERWRLAAAYLFTVGVPPEQVGAHGDGGGGAVVNVGGWWGRGRGGVGSRRGGRGGGTGEGAGEWRAEGGAGPGGALYAWRQAAGLPCLAASLRAGRRPWPASGRRQHGSSLPPPPPSPPQISGLFARHASLFRTAVARPDSLRRLFEWLAQDLGLEGQALLKLVNRCPAVLQVGRGVG